MFLLWIHPTTVPLSTVILLIFIFNKDPFPANAWSWKQFEAKSSWTLFCIMWNQCLPVCNKPTVVMFQSAPSTPATDVCQARQGPHGDPTISISFPLNSIFLDQNIKKSAASEFLKNQSAKNIYRNTRVKAWRPCLFHHSDLCRAVR